MQPHSYNTDTERVDSQRVKSVTTMGWVNYKKPGYSWDKISNLILPDGTVTKQNLNVQFPGSSQGWTDILFDSQFSIIRSRIDGRSENNEPALELSVCVETQHNVTGTVDPNDPSVMLYSNAWDGADLRMGTFSGMRPRLNKIIAIKEMPAGDGEYVEYSFLMRSNKAKATVDGVRPWNGNPGDYFNLFGREAFIGREDSEIRGAILGQPKCWWYTTDEDGEEIQETRDIELHCTVLSDGETVRATKKIPRAYIQQAISDGSYLFTDEVFYTDYNSPGRDFWTHRKAGESGFSSAPSTQSYAQMMYESSDGTGGADNSGGNDAVPPGAPWFRMQTGSNYQRIAIKGFFFDTRSLAGAVDTTATHKIEIPIKEKGADGGQQTNIFSSNGADNWTPTYPSPDNSLSYLPNGYKRELYSSIYGQTALSTAKTYAQITNDSANATSSSSYNEFILNSTGESNINKNGFTKILMTFENWDSRVGGSDPGISTNSNYKTTCWHPDDSKPGLDTGKLNDGARLTATFKQITNPGGFWFMG